MAGKVLKKALQSVREIMITVNSRRGPRKITIPVWFVQEGEKLLLLPVRGSDNQWYQHLVKDPMLTVSAEGFKTVLRATPTTDPSTVKMTIDKFRAKYGAADIQKYYSKFDACVESTLQ